jgi:hypothetical protein
LTFNGLDNVISQKIENFITSNPTVGFKCYFNYLGFNDGLEKWRSVIGTSGENL